MWIPARCPRRSQDEEDAMGRTSLAAAEERHSVEELEELAFELRQKLLELCGTYEGAVHIGGDLSAADIFTALFH
jgi:transketolase